MPKIIEEAGQPLVTAPLFVCADRQRGYAEWMAHALEYHDSAPRRRRWIWAVMLLAIIVSGVLAVPKYKTFRAQQERRAAIRSQFAAQLATAKTLIGQKRLDDAAMALIRAEFPTHIDSHLFWQSELNAFGREVEQVRQQIDKVNGPILKEQEEWRQQAKKEREHEEENSTRNVAVNYRRDDVEQSARQKTIMALETRGAQMLKAGNSRVAEAICLQIVELDPPHRFDNQFWSNVPK